jgi:hypothetical protein
MSDHPEEGGAAEEAQVLKRVDEVVVQRRLV